MGSLFTTDCIEASKSILVQVLLPLGMLITSTLASTISFSLECHMRVDILVILHNVIGFLTCSMYTYLRMSTTYSLTNRDHLKEIILCGLKMVCSISVPMFVIVAIIIADARGICYQQSTNFSLVWYSIVSACSIATTFTVPMLIFCKFLSKRKRGYWRRRKENAQRFLKAKSMLPTLMRLKGKREGWKMLHDEFCPVYMNLQDYQKESLLPIFVLYAMDELTWELRDIDQKLKSVLCPFCEEGIQDSPVVISSFLDPDVLMHRYCLKTQMMIQKSSFRMRRRFLNTSTDCMRKFSASVTNWLQKTELNVQMPDHTGTTKKLGVFGANHEQTKRNMIEGRHIDPHQEIMEIRQLLDQIALALD